EPVAAEPPAHEAHGERRHREEEPRLEDVSGDGGAPAHYASSSRSSASSSASPCGGQSGSGASQRLEQCREAMFCSGIRMCHFSSMWATSPTYQYAVSTPSWYSPPNRAISTCSPLYLLV